MPKKIDRSKFKLGKKPAVHDKRTLQLANYLKIAQLPPIPASYSWATDVKSPWGMMANDRLGDCTCAAAGHLILEWTSDNNAPVVPTDQQIIDAYSAITGYNPQTGANDNGAVETDVLNYWRQTGIAGHQIGAYAALEPKNHTHVQATTWLFGGVYLGMSLPLSAQSQTVWSVPPGGATGDGAPGSWGGHAVPVVAYDADGLTVVTWGELLTMTWSFLDTYCEESYAIISPDFVNGTKPSPGGFDLASLQDDLKDVTSA